MCRNVTRSLLTTPRGLPARGPRSAPGSVFVRPYIEQHYFTRAKLNQHLTGQAILSRARDIRGQHASPENVFLVWRWLEREVVRKRANAPADVYGRD